MQNLGPRSGLPNPTLQGNPRHHKAGEGPQGGEAPALLNRAPVGVPGVCVGQNRKVPVWYSGVTSKGTSQMCAFRELCSRRCSFLPSEMWHARGM